VVRVTSRQHFCPRGKDPQYPLYRRLEEKSFAPAVVMVKGCFFFAVQNEFLNNISTSFGFGRLKEITFRLRDYQSDRQTWKQTEYCDDITLTAS
jgi:hypothetical protein